MNADLNAPVAIKKTGKIMLVGLGPGSNDHLTARARAAIAEADAGWVTMHGPKIEHKRRQGELNAAMAISACGGGSEQMTEEEAARV